MSLLPENFLWYSLSCDNMFMKGERIALPGQRRYDKGLWGAVEVVKNNELINWINESLFGGGGRSD